MELFLKDNHSPDHVALEIVNENSSKELFELLIDHFPDLFQHETPFIAEVIGGANINSLNFRINKKYYLKFLPVNNSKLKPKEFYFIADQLIHSGFNVAHFYFPKDKAIDKIYSIKSDLLNGEYWVLLQDFVSDKFYSGCKGEVKQIPELIRKLELIFIENSNFTVNSSSPINAELIKNDWKRILQYVAQNGRGEDHYINQVYSRIQENIEIFFKENESRLKDFDSSSKQGIYHSDLHPHNLLADDSEKIWVIDHESFKFMPVSVYRGFSIFKLFRKSISNNHCTVKEIKDLIVSNYTKQETDEMLIGAQVELIRRIVLVLTLNYFQKDNRWNADLIKHTNGLSECNVLFSYEANAL
jgi:thiamine kinase-like enzyme